MTELTFNELPKAVTQLFDKLESIERLLLAKSDEHQPEADQLLTIQQASELICLAVPTVYGLVSRSEIPVSKKGKRLYFSRHELMSWVKSGRKKTVEEIQTEAKHYVSRKKEKPLK